MKKLPFKNKFLLAPMEEVNDIAFRLLCKKAHAGACYTGMIHPLTQQKIQLADKPVLQLFCTSDKGVKDFIKKYEKKVLGFDLNLGCPATTARKHGFGSYLIDLKAIEQILKTMRASTKKPIFAKIRKSNISFDILKLANKYCDAICIHPRTQAQGYSGKPDLEFALEIKKKTNLPVIYSGDADEFNAKELLEKFDYVMFGRRAMGDANLFSKLQGKTTHFGFKDYLKLAIKYKLYFRQIKFQAMNFTKRMPNAKSLRLQIFKAKTLGDLERVF